MVLRDLLIEIFRMGPENLIFKGGTALSFFYGSGRFSEDIDFSSTNIDDYAVIDSALESFGNRYNYKIVNDWENEIEQSSNKFRRYFLSIKGSFDHNIETRIDYSIGRCELGPVKEYLSNEYYALKVDVMRLEEILAEKVRTLYTRQKGRDLYDIHYLSVVKRVAVPKSLIFDKFKEDSTLKGTKYSFKSFEAKIENLRPLWNDLEGIVSNFKSLSFDTVKEGVLASFRNV